MDSHFLLSGLEFNLPWLCALLHSLPIPAVKEVLASRPRLRKVGRRTPNMDEVFCPTNALTQAGKDALDEYLQKYGRDSGRKDLLTNILIVKPRNRDSYTL